MPKFTIFCAGMSRSGSTLQYIFCKELIERHGLGWDVIKSERPAKWMLRHVNSGNGLAVNIYRDPRDVLVSLWGFFDRRDRFHQKDIEWNFDMAFVELEQTLSWQIGWEDNVSILKSYRYEDYHPYNWYKHVLGLQELFALDRNSEEAHDIADMYNVDRNIARSESLDRWWDTPDTLLTARHISPLRGKVGQYGEVLKLDQINIVETFAGDWMRKRGYI